jgi:hypothetical protein
MEFLSILITIIGFILGLGAVTVIDLHGFMARKSSYWTRATIQTHKITKPLIWAGITLIFVGHILLKKSGVLDENAIFHFLIIGVLILNGYFLSFVVSPALLTQEKEGRSEEILPKSLQSKITVSFIFSVLGWWGLVFLFVKSLV